MQICCQTKITILLSEANHTVNNERKKKSWPLDIRYPDICRLHQKAQNTGCCPQRLNHRQTVADGRETNLVDAHSREYSWHKIPR